MSKKHDLHKQKFGRLTAIKPVCRLLNGKIVRKWECICTCGNKCEVITWCLTTGHTKSCGCLHREVVSEKTTTHGLTKTTEYKSWAGMKERCLNPKNKRYKNYGARGITVCDRWLNSFENFLEDMGKKPSLELSIERINNDSNYEPENCKWATQLEQCANTRNLKWFFAFNEKTGETYRGNNQHEFGRQYGLDYRNISACLCGKRNYHKNWQFEFIEEVIWDAKKEVTKN